MHQSLRLVLHIIHSFCEEAKKRKKTPTIISEGRGCVRVSQSIVSGLGICRSGSAFGIACLGPLLGSADRRYLSEGAVRSRVTLSLSKLAVPGRTQAAVLAIQHGLGGG